MTTANQLSQLGSPGVSTGFKNRIINGSMVINQRGGTVTAVSSGTFSVDRFRGYANGGGVFTLVQSSTVPTGAGFVNSNLLTVTTADSSIGSTDYYSYSQDVEGYNIADFQWGTASAKTVTASFWVNSSVTGLYALALINSDGSRCYPATYTISAANTWQFVSVTVPGCTDGTWQSTTSTGLVARFDLGSGSSNNGTANTWNTAGSYAGCRTSSTVNWIATNGATFYITGVQLEVGTTATNFDYRSYGTELALCQRYFQRITPGTGRPFSGSITQNSTAWCQFPTKATMRIAPSVTDSNPTLVTVAPGGNNVAVYFSGYVPFSGITYQSTGPDFFNFAPYGIGTVTPGQGVTVDTGPNFYINLSSEL